MDRRTHQHARFRYGGEFGADIDRIERLAIAERDAAEQRQQAVDSKPYMCCDGTVPISVADVVSSRPRRAAARTLRTRKPRSCDATPVCPSNRT